jgi:hypothetical protein
LEYWNNGIRGKCPILKFFCNGFLPIKSLFQIPKTQYFYPVKLLPISLGPLFSPRRRLYELEANIPLFQELGVNPCFKNLCFFPANGGIEIPRRLIIA